MRPVKLKEANFTYTAPKGVPATKCEDLPVYRATGDLGVMNVSCWEVTDDELYQIETTRKVWLCVIGAQHPPVMLFTEPPVKAKH